MYRCLGFVKTTFIWLSVLIKRMSLSNNSVVDKIADLHFSIYHKYSVTSQYLTNIYFTNQYLTEYPCDKSVFNINCTYPVYGV